MRHRSAVFGLLAATVLLLATACSAAAGFGIDTGSIPRNALCPGRKPADHITVIDWWQTLASPVEAKAAPDFNCSHPHIAVNISVDENVGDDNNGKLLAAVAAHKPPDLVLAYDDVLAAWAAKGELQPVEDEIAAHGLKPSDFNSYAWKSTLWQGHQYGLPADWDPDTLLWYNKKVFKEVGLDPDRPPTTWDQIQRYAKRIDLIEHGKIKRLGFIPWAGWQFNYIQLGHLFGAKFDDGVQAHASVDTPEFRKVMRYEASLARRYGGGAKVNSFTTLTGAQGAAADPLMAGRVGMYMVGDWQMGQENNVGKKKFNQTVGVTALPPPEGGTQYLSHSGWAYMVPKGSPHRKEAMEFAAWLDQPKNFAKYIGTTHGWLPALKAGRSRPYLTSDPAWRAIMAVEKHIGTQWWLRPSPILQQYYRIIDQTQDAVVALEKTPAEALRQADEQIKAAVDSAAALGVYRE